MRHNTPASVGADSANRNTIFANVPSKLEGQMAIRLNPEAKKDEDLLVHAIKVCKGSRGTAPHIRNLSSKCR